MWELENAFNGRFQTSIEQEGKGSKLLWELKLASKYKQLQLEIQIVNLEVQCNYI